MGHRLHLHQDVVGFVYVAFVIDCFSRAIVGWHASTVKDTAMVTTALKMALWRRGHGGHRVGADLIHHSDAGSQADSIGRPNTPMWRCSMVEGSRRLIRAAPEDAVARQVGIPAAGRA